MESKSLNIKIYPKLIQEFATENFNLKALCGALLGLLFILLILVVYFIHRGPLVIALDGHGRVTKIETKITDVQIKEAAENYISYRYQWTGDTIVQQLKAAELFIEPALVGSFRKSMIEIQKYVKEKKVKQKIYPYDIQINLKEKKVTVLADRITEFDSLKGATVMRLVLSFSIGERTSVNPWGVYISKESEGVLE